MICVKCSVPILSDKNKTTKDQDFLLLTNHPIQHKLVVLTTPNGEKFNVVANDLVTAVTNATNTNRF